jgi:Fic family protein
MHLNQMVIDRLSGKHKQLQSSRPLSPTIVAKLQERFMLEMTYNSNAIEGNTLTLKETYLVLSEGITIKGKSLKDHLEAKNHHEALEFIFEQVEHDSQHTISEHLIRELQSLVIGNIDKSIAGTYRDVEVAITASSHQPPLATEVPGKMSDLIKWFRREQLKLNPIELAAILHHKLVNIHPFADGNGRTARLLMNIILLQAGYPLVIIFKNDRRKYYDTLSLADNGNLDQFITFIARAVERSLDIYLDTITKNRSSATKFISLSELGRKYDLTQKHLNLLARTGKIVAHKQGRIWVSSIEAIQQYLDNRERK